MTHPSLSFRQLAFAGLAFSVLMPCAARAEEAGITLPPGFTAEIFADKIGHARQLVVAPNGVVYVNTWSGVYYNNRTPHAGGFLVALKDTTGSGHADIVKRFGKTFADGNAGGTGIGIFDGKLYAEANDRIDRYILPADGEVPTDAPDTIVHGMPITGDHPMHPFVIGPDGALYVDVGTATNSCQPQNRMTGIKGADPCVELETRGGIWKFDARTTGQAFSPSQRYATGLRNGEGLSFDSDGRLFSTQHGRDQLSESWGTLYTPKQGAELPSEELVQLKDGADFGWPYCYYDPNQARLVLAPEYGGDGGKKIGVCADKTPPVAAFPAHWAPNDMKIYHGTSFPAAYRDGAFIAFHGSWNRAPSPQDGFDVVFQPMKDGKANGPYVVFADGFAGPVKEPGRALHRPGGLAVGPDGALYISDDQGGRIWRVTYQGDPAAPIAAAARVASTSTAEEVPPPEGLHPEAGRASALPTPKGMKPETVALGGRIFHGEEAGGTCAGCHGSDAGGGPIGADLTAGTWIWGDGSLASLKQTIVMGVPAPKQHPGAMPPKGGADLTDAQIDAVTAYVWSVGHQKHK